MSIKSIRNALVAQLQTIPGIKAVYGCVVDEPAGMPCIMISQGKGAKASLDTFNDTLSQRFFIYLIFRMSADETDADAVYDKQDAILDLFNSNANKDTLGGAVHKFVVEDWEPFEITTPEDLMGVRFIVSTETIYPFS